MGKYLELRYRWRQHFGRTDTYGENDYRSRVMEWCGSVVNTPPSPVGKQNYKKRDTIVIHNLGLKSRRIK